MRPKHIKPSAIFPALKKRNHEVTSDDDPLYNCIAHAAGANNRRWWPTFRPDGYWPPGVPVVETLDAFIKAFATLGYEVCDDGGFENGFEKVAIFTKDGIPTHAARQIDATNWTSKLGFSYDISHFLDAVGGGPYGAAAKFMKRAKQ
jgi:hypothetical protein